MTVPTRSSPGNPSRLSAPGVIVTLFVLAMSACVLGLVIWKAVDSRKIALTQSVADIQNLAHSLQERTSHTFQAADVAMNGIADLLRYQPPQPDRFNALLAKTAASLPQLQTLEVVSAQGDRRYASSPQMPPPDNLFRDDFIYHRDHADSRLRISTPMPSRTDGNSIIVLSKRIDGPDGHFNCVLRATIDVGYFNGVFRTSMPDDRSSIRLLRSDGIVLANWPSLEVDQALSNTPLIQTKLKEGPSGFYRTTSPLDGSTTYVGYEQSPDYPVIVMVAVPEDALLSEWRDSLPYDSAVAAVLLCSVILLAALLSTQFRFRLKMENALRERESHYRLLADNIADVIILLDPLGNIVFVSHSVKFVLGLNPEDLIGRSCLDLVHPDDVNTVRNANALLTDPTSSHTVIFRTYRDDRSLAWVEVNFKMATRAVDRDKIEIVGVLRDVTQRKTVQDELSTLNSRLAELATTDSLTELANRRTFDDFLHQAYEQHADISVLLIDVDHFKGYNDSNGHQAGDRCLKCLATVLADATINTPALAARYGGEEFAIVLPGVKESDAVTVAEAVRLRVRALRIPNAVATRGYLSISIGVASRNARTSNEIVLVGEADLALYEAKRRGRDCVVTHSSLEHAYFSAGFSQNI